MENIDIIAKDKNEFLEIRNSDAFGRYLIANQDIPERTLILSEASLIYSPSDDCDDNTGSVNKGNRKATIFCLGCCLKLKSTEWVPCSRCGWPLCSNLCKSGSVHSQNECGIFEENEAVFPPPNTWPILYKSVLVLRILLLVKEKKPSCWNDFFEKLEDQNDIRTTKDRCINSDRMIFENIRYFTKLTTQVDYYRDEELLRRITGVLNVNAFCANKDNPLGGYRKVKCMFEKGSIFAHSCAPNCTWKIDVSPDKNFIPIIKVFTSISIKRHELITIPYNTRHLFYGTLKRQLLIESVAHFICKCLRCKDPTENGTYMSALRCFGCTDGYLVPKDPLDSESRWNCILKECQTACSVEKIVCLITGIEDEFDVIESAEFPKNIHLPKLHQIFQKHHDEGTVLHKNHYVLQEMSTKILELSVDQLADASSGEIDSFLWHCQYLLDIANVILPGFNGYRDQLRDYQEEGLFHQRFKKNPEIPK